MRISFTGDIMCELPMLRACKKGEDYDFSGVFDNAAATFSKSDYIVGNLETVFAGSEMGYSNDIYSYNTPDSFLYELKKFGFSLVSTANNHCLDRGVEGLDRTLLLLDELGIEHTGTYLRKEDKEDYIIKQFGKHKIGFISYTYGTNYKINHYKLDEANAFKVNLLSLQDNNTIMTKKKSINKKIKDLLFTKEFRVRWLRKLGRPYAYPRSDDEPPIINPQFYKDIQSARSKCDILVLLMHSGGQFNDMPGIYTQIIVKEALSSGVDCIIGNHPHIVQEAGFIDGAFVSYSLGNFVISTSTPYLIPDYKPEYTIVIHMNIDIENHISYSFSILHLREGKDKVVKVYDTWQLYSKSSEKEKEQLLQDCSFVYSRVTGRDALDFEMAEEYIIDYQIS